MTSREEHSGGMERIPRVRQRLGPKVGRLALCLALSALAGAKLLAGPQGSAPASEAQAKFAGARQLMGEGNFQQAIGLVQEGLKLSPKSVEGYNLLGILYTQQKDYTRSAAAFQQALRIDPRSTVTHNNLGSSFVAQDRLDPAKREYLTTLRLDPHNREANYNLGRIALSERQAAQAITYFRQVQPPDTSSSMNLLSAFLMAGRTEDATALAARISDQNKADVRVHFSLGVLLAQGKLYPPAIHELELADALDPGTFEILYDLGEAYSQNRDNEKAEQAFDRALKLRPDSTAVMYSLGKLYYNQGRDLPAIEILMRAHKLEPQNTNTIFLLARLSMVEKYFADAIPLLQEAIRIDPKRPDLHAALGDCYFTVGKVDGAIAEFQTLIDIAPVAGSYAFMGICYRHLGRYEEANKYLKKGLELDPHDSACLFNLGYIAARQGDMQAAEGYLQAVLKSKPNYDDALFELAGLRMKAGRFQDAVPLLRRCIEINPNRSEAYYKLAVSERSLHQMEAADRDFRVFATMSKNAETGVLPFQHLFDYLDQKTGLPPQDRARLDLAGLQAEFAKNPDKPRTLYLLADAYLRLGRNDEALKAIAHLDEVSKQDFRTSLQEGVLLAQHHLLPEAVRHFQAALSADPSSDDAKYDLANAYFEQQDYVNARRTLDQISAAGREDEPYLALVGDVDTRLGMLPEAQEAYKKALARSPDNAAHYVALALAQLRGGDTSGAGQTLHAGLSRIPDSGRIAWGQGVLAVMENHCSEAEQHFARALDLLPDWPSAYSTLAVLYLNMGQAAKARAVFSRYQEVFPQGPLDAQMISRQLAAAEESPQSARTLTPQMQAQFLQLAFALADRNP